MLFCPFCREAFDDETRCPDHDVALVSLRELGRMAAQTGAEERVLAWWSPRFARGWVALGAIGTLTAFVCPFGHLTGDVARTSSLLTLARGHAVRLWIVPIAALTLLWMLLRRRTPATLRAARVAAVFVACLPSIVVIVTWLGAREAADVLAIKLAGVVEFHLGIGAWLVWASGLSAVAGGLRLGVGGKRFVR
ncbi:MAG: hypothetical protein ABW321_35370 [Polyangiales bacterium]